MTNLVVLEVVRVEIALSTAPIVIVPTLRILFLPRFMLVALRRK